MEVNSKPFQGVFNIIRFNWQFYVLAFGIMILFLLIQSVFPVKIQFWIQVGSSLASLAIVVSLLISFYVYDLSSLYQLKWLTGGKHHHILNVHAGFDETSQLIQQKYPDSAITICDFYDPQKHTEISIKRARKAYPPNPNTYSVQTSLLPFETNNFDTIIVMLSAHEIRNEKERIQFFKELNRVTQNDGEIYVTEHVRDFNNFIAYTVGFFHFLSRKTWLRTFSLANLKVKNVVRVNLFITTFILENDGDSL